MIEINGININIELHGASLSENGTIDSMQPVLIGIPGGPGFSHTILKPSLNPISDYFPVLYFDPRGTGKSDIGDRENWNLDCLADDIADLIKKLNIQKPYVYAHSLGCTVAGAVVSKYPGLICGVVCANAMLVSKEDAFENWIKLGGNISRRMMVDLDFSAVPEFMETVLPKYDPIARPIEHAQTIEANVEQCLFMIHDFLDVSLIQRVEKESSPFHFIIGKLDPLNPPSQAITILEGAKTDKLTFEVFANSGHDNLLCDPDKTVETVLNFIRTNEG